MVPNLRRARVGALLILLWASGCSLFSGVYLHDDAYQQKADSAQADFNKIDLTSKFNDQFTKVTSYDNDEDKAVAQLQTASRNRQLQDFIQLPGWHQACSDDENRQVSCSGAPGLSYEVRQTLSRLTGYSTLDANQREGLHDALFLAPADADALKATRKKLARDLSAFATARGQAPPNPCPPVALQTPWPPHCDDPDADCFWKRVQSDCGDIASYSRSQRLLGLNPWLGGEIRTLVNTRDAAVDLRKNDQAEADALTQQIKEITSSNTKSDKSDASSGDLSTTVDQIQSKLNDNSFPAVAKYLGLTALSSQLQSLLSDQLAQNAPQPQSSAQKPQPKSSPKSNQVQALIDLATSAKSLTDAYAGKGPHDRVNALLLATAASRHQADMAKLDADYQADVITIYNAEIDSRLRQTVHLDEANMALASRKFAERGFASPPPSQIQMDALAAWSASQDEGEIPYQVLAAKEVQLLRAQSVKKGQLSAQGYENVIKPVLAELDAYGKGGITTQTIVQALGFVGVIASTSAK